MDRCEKLEEISSICDRRDQGKCSLTVRNNMLPLGLMRRSSAPDHYGGSARPSHSVGPGEVLRGRLIGLD